MPHGHFSYGLIKLSFMETSFVATLMSRAVSWFGEDELVSALIFLMSRGLWMMSIEFCFPGWLPCLQPDADIDIGSSNSGSIRVCAGCGEDVYSTIGDGVVQEGQMYKDDPLQ